LTVFKLAYGRRFRTGLYETGEIRLEEDFDTDSATPIEAHDELKILVDALVRTDKEYYGRESAERPERKR
jgi:hypothetical protein